MKQISLLLNIHSHLDLITNSSTELFITGGENNVDTVKEILQEILDSWNKLARTGAFGPHWVKNKRKYLNKEQEKLEPIYKLDDILEVFVFTENMFKAQEDYGWGYEKRENIGKIIIESRTDNSIPYEMFEWIEEAFCAKRYHLG